MRILVALVIALIWSLKSYSSTVVLEVGASESIKAPTTGSVRIKNGKLITVNDLGRELKIIGRKVGNATVTTAADTTDVFVLDHPEYKFYKNAKLAMAEMRGLELIVNEGGVRIRGKLLRVGDWATIAELAETAKYTFQAEIDSNIRDSVKEMIEKKLRSANLNLPVVKFDPGASILVAKDQASQVDLYSRVVAPLGLKVESTDAVVELQPLIRVKIAVTEIRKNFLQKFGVTWPTSANAQLLPSFVGPGAGEGINVQLDALEASGVGKILASPNILCRSGKSAEFFAGGEFPIKIISHSNRDVIWKKHGIILKVEPVADASGRMSIGLTTEVSTVDQSLTVDGVPGLLTNRIESHFDLSRSRTIALSGLLKEETGNSREGLPGLSSIPILGLLFSSQDYRDHKTELIVFVTPEVVKEEDSEQPL